MQLLHMAWRSLPQRDVEGSVTAPSTAPPPWCSSSTPLVAWGRVRPGTWGGVGRRPGGLSLLVRAALLGAFGQEPEALARLALCRMLATTLDLERIAAHVGLEPAGLGELLQLDVLP